MERRVPSAVAEKAAAVAEPVRTAGGRAFVVGGAVRDALLGRADASKDIDIEVFGIDAGRLKEALSRRFEFDECGASFGVLKLKRCDIDVSLPRRETKTGAGHRDFAVASDPSLSVAEAAERRDFTVNAIYFDPLEGTFADPAGGMRDLEAGTLRHVSAKFSEDPLRVLRGMQFVARFGFDAHPGTVALCRSMDIEGLARERLMDEWAKLVLKGRWVSKGLSFLRDTGWTRHFPELERLIGCGQDPEWHPEGDVWNHTLLSMDAFARRRTGQDGEDLVVGLAVLCHDFGKPDTTFFDRDKGRIRSPGHDERGAKEAEAFLSRLTNEERILKEVPPLVRCHMRPFAMWKSGSGDGAVRRLARQVGRIDRLLRVAWADAEGVAPGRGGEAAHPELDWLAERAEALRVADSAPRPILLGRHLVEMGFSPSPLFGKVLSACFERQLDGALSTVAEAAAFARSEMERLLPGAGR